VRPGRGPANETILPGIRDRITPENDLSTVGSHDDRPRYEQCDPVDGYHCLTNHARVRFWQGSWMVEDVGSTNGIIINGERVGKASLKPGSSFRIGQTIFTLVERAIAKSKDRSPQPSWFSLQPSKAWRAQPSVTERNVGLDDSWKSSRKFPSSFPSARQSASIWRRPPWCIDLARES
jgi:FHA domain